MNAKQSLKAASKRIIDLEDFNRRSSAEIRGLNNCIDSVIAGQYSFCDWCMEKDECQREERGSGCSQWWLTDNPPVQDHDEGSEADESKGILSASPTGGE